MKLINPCEYVCARCASQSSTCCALGSGRGADCFPLSGAEAGRINAAIEQAKHIAAQTSAKPQTNSAGIDTSAYANASAETGTAVSTGVSTYTGVSANLDAGINTGTGIDTAISADVGAGVSNNLDLTFTPAEAKLLCQTALTAYDAHTQNSGYCASEANSAEFIKAMYNLFPKDKDKIPALFPSGQTHLRLALNSSGTCALLSPTGCTLPSAARPWFCRIFPFWVIKNTLQCFADDACLAVKENTNFNSLMLAFNTNKQEITALYASLRTDWGLN